MAVPNLQWNHARMSQLESAIIAGALCAGNAAAFVVLDDSAGAKLFPCAEWRDYARDKQLLVHGHKLAPAVGDSFEIPAEMCTTNELIWKYRSESKARVFGYLTQRADTSTQATEAEMLEVVRRLVAAVDLGAPTEEEFEMNPNNFGTLDGSWVCIDFDEGTWT